MTKNDGLAVFAVAAYRTAVALASPLFKPAFARAAEMPSSQYEPGMSASGFGVEWRGPAEA